MTYYTPFLKLCIHFLKLYTPSLHSTVYIYTNSVHMGIVLDRHVVHLRVYAEHPIFNSALCTMKIFITLYRKKTGLYPSGCCVGPIPSEQPQIADSSHV